MKTRLVTLIPLLIFTALCTAAENPPPGRKFVGSLGMPSAIEITGAKTFTAVDLRFALAGSYAYLLAAHPSAPFHSYAATVEAALVKGYRHAGFRDARVKAAASTAGDRLLVQVEEGRRFVQGDIRITGVPAAFAKELTGVLTEKPAPVTETLADRVTDFIEERAEPKRKAAVDKVTAKLAVQLPSVGVGKTSVADLTANISADVFLGADSLKRQKEADPFWKSGDSFSFETQTADGAAKKLRSVLAERGKALMGVKAKTTEDDATGRVDLTYHLTDAPDAVVGEILVTGNKRDTAVEIIAASGLKKGAPFTSDTIRRANLSLWNSARFLNFDLTSVARDGQRPEVDITVDVEEDAKMQPLREPLTRGQQALVRLAGWMMMEIAKREVSIRIADDSKNAVSLAISPRAGFGVAFTGGGEGTQMFGVHGGVEKSLVVAASGGRAAAREFGNTRGMFNLKLELIPSPRDRGAGGQTKAFNFYYGYSTENSKAGGEHAAIRTEMIFAPVVFCSEDWARSGSGVKFENGTVRAEYADKKEKGGIRFVEATGELIGVSAEHLPFFETSVSVSLGVKPGEVARIRGVLDDARRGHDSAKLAEQSFLELIATSPAVAKFSRAVFKENDLQKIGIIARLVEKATGAFLSHFLQERREEEGKQVFFIPIDPGVPTSVLASMGGVMLFQWAQELWPPDAWPAKLTREIFYVATVNTSYTPLVLDELYQDPKMGPLGSHATAQLLAKMDPAGARRFLRRARERSSAEDLRREMELLLDVRGKGSGIIRDLIGEFEKLDLDSITVLAGSLGPEFAEDVRHWRTDLAKMHDRPPAEVLLPHLLRGWERGGRAKFVEKMDDLLATSGPDPWNAAAVVNGEPVSRKWVERFGPAMRIHELIPPRPVPAGEKPPDAHQQSLDAFIALRLVERDFMQGGGKIAPEVQPKALEWIARGNMPEFEKALGEAHVKQKEMAPLFRQLIYFAAFSENLRASLKPPGAEELNAAVEARLKESAARLHLRFIRGPKAGDGRAALERLRAQAAEKNFKTLWDAANAKKDGGIEAGEYEELDHETLNETLTKAAFALDAGQTGEIVEASDFCYLLHVVSKSASGKFSAEARNAAEGKLAGERMAKAVAERVEQLRARAVIERIDLPKMPSTPPPPQGATRLEAETLEVLAKHDAETSVMSMEQWGAEHWSGGKQAFVNAKAGGWVEWGFDAPEARGYRLVLHATRASHFGKITVAIDGEKFDMPVDLYAADDVIPSGPRALGERDLARGAHKLRITVEEGNAEASAADFGFDALDLIPSALRPLGVGKKK